MNSANQFVGKEKRAADETAGGGRRTRRKMSSFEAMASFEEGAPIATTDARRRGFKIKLTTEPPRSTTGTSPNPTAKGGNANSSRPPNHERRDKCGGTVLMDEKYAHCKVNGEIQLNLHQCCDSQLLDAAQGLVEFDPRYLTQADDQGLLPFWYAGCAGHTDLLPMLIAAAQKAFPAAEARRVTVGCRRHDGQTLLHIAAANDFEPITALLLRHGAEVDAKTENCTNPPGVTPLMIAGQFNSTRVASLLCRHGAELNVRTNEKDYTAFHYALSYGNTELAAFLHAKGARTGCDAKRCIKCRLQSTRMTRKNNEMRERVRQQLSEARQEEQRRREIEHVIDEMMFADFEKALQEAASGVADARDTATLDEQDAATKLLNASFEGALREAAGGEQLPEEAIEVEGASTAADESSGKRSRKRRGGAKKKK